MDEEKYLFWVGSFKYLGIILSENDTHWVVKDDKIGEISLPKGSTVRIKVQKSDEKEGKNG